MFENDRKETTSKAVTSIRHWNYIEKSMRKTQQNFVDFESRIHIEISMSNRCYNFHVDSPFKIGKSRRTFYVELRCRTDGESTKMCPFGFNFVKEFLDGNEIAESTFWERLRTLEIEAEILNNPWKKGNFFFLPKKNSFTSVDPSDISYNQFSSSTPSCPQNLGHDLSIISEEIEALDKIINQSLQFITRDPTMECASIETQTGDVH